MSRVQSVAVLAGFLAAIALAYFGLIAAKPRPLARVLLHRGYEQRGWNEQRLALRLRLLGVLGAVLALAAILLAIVRFVG